MPPARRTTIREIARACGVSVQTVSRVLNGRPDVAPATRALVEATIAASDYRPSAAARSLVRGRSRMLGVIVAGLRYFGVAETLNGIAEQAEAAGYAILLKEVDVDDRSTIGSVFDFLIGHGVEGVIYAAPEMSTPAAALPSASPPVVSLKTADPSARVSVLIDNRGGARLATDHLVRSGRTRIGLISGPLAWREARDRQDGWRDALDAAGLAPGPVEVGDWTSAGGEAAMTRLVIAGSAVDAVFVANDQMAIGALRAAHARGIRVPDSIAVVGFDGLDEGAQAIPSLTTVVQPLRHLGELGVTELLQTIDREPGAGEPRTLVLGTKLVVRESAPAV
jgi:DNA-binding LacI/PurR family transcriptional regulator